MPRETVVTQRERGEREGSVISVAESMSKKSRPRVSGDLYSKWHDNSELSFLGDASGKIH